MKRLMVLFLFGNIALFIGNLLLVACDDSSAAIGDLTLVEEEAVFPLTGNDFSTTATCPEGTRILSGACKVTGNTDAIPPDGYNLSGSGPVISTSIDATANSYTCTWGDDYDWENVRDNLTFITQALCG